MGKFVHEVKDLPVDEFDGWLIYFKWKEEQEKKASKRKSKSSSPNSVKL